MPDVSEGITVEAERFATAQMTCACWWCGESTRVVGIVVFAGHRMLRDGEWTLVPHSALLFGIRDLNEMAVGSVEAMSPWMQKRDPVSLGTSVIGNVCEWCRAIQSDRCLLSKAGNALSADSTEIAATIAIREFSVPLRAACDGETVGLPWENSLLLNLTEGNQQ